MQQGQRLLGDPAVLAQPGAVFGAAPGDDRRDTHRPNLLAIVVVVVGTVGCDPLWPSTRPTDAATYRRDAIDERDQLGDVVAVAARERPGERDPRRIDKEVVLGAVSGSINRARARRGPPFFACT